MGRGVTDRLAVTEDKVPADWAALIDPKWQGRIILSDPRALGASSITLAELSLKGVIDDEWLKALAKLDPQIVDSATSIGQPLASGAADVALWGGGWMVAMEKTGAPVGWNGSSTVQSPTAAVLVKGAPNPEAAKVFMDWMLSDNAQAAFATDGFIPQMPNSALPGFITAEERTSAPIMPPFKELAPEVKRIMNLMTELLG